MSKKTLCLILFFLLAYLAQAAVSEPIIKVIPQPLSIKTAEGYYLFSPKTVIHYSSDAAKIAELFQELVQKPTGYRLKAKKALGRATPGIAFLLDTLDTALEKEAYALTVSPESITVKASTYAGLFNGMQTVRQLLPSDIESPTTRPGKEWRVPCVEIYDKPAYAWRGYMKDVSRTFYSVDILKKYLDVMSLYKMNIFHLHLTDDQGWRIEIKKYPELTSAKTTRFPEQFEQPTDRSGYYTQKEIIELVTYAKERNITIVPEIEMPGHCWPIILAYPELAVNSDNYPDFVFPFRSSWDFWNNQFTPNTVDPTNEKVYAFFSDIFDEILPLFPSEYIHIGGDEVMHEVWEKEPHIIDYMKKNNLQNSADLQRQFISRIVKIVLDKGRKPMGWDDIVANPEGLSTETGIMSWLGKHFDYISKGFKVVVAPSSRLYLDICQADRNDGTLADLGYSNTNSLEKIYEYNPASQLPVEQKPFLLGIQANFWSHVALNVKDMNVQVFPRLLAVSEIAWTNGERKNFGEFTTRLQDHLKRLDHLRIDYYHPGGYILDTWTSENTPQSFTKLSWNVTKQVYANGDITVCFFHKEGSNFLKIRGVELLENGKVISSDIRRGLSGKCGNFWEQGIYTYRMKVDHYRQGAEYTLRVDVKGDKGTDSYGNLTFNLSPYITTTHTK